MIRPSGQTVYDALINIKSQRTIHAAKFLHTWDILRKRSLSVEKNSKVTTASTDTPVQGVRFNISKAACEYLRLVKTVSKNHTILNNQYWKIPTDRCPPRSPLSFICFKVMWKLLFVYFREWYYDVQYLFTFSKRWDHIPLCSCLLTINNPSLTYSPKGIISFTSS